MTANRTDPSADAEFQLEEPHAQTEMSIKREATTQPQHESQNQSPNHSSEEDFVILPKSDLPQQTDELIAQSESNVNEKEDVVMEENYDDCDERLKEQNMMEEKNYDDCSQLLVPNDQQGSEEKLNGNQDNQEIQIQNNEMKNSVELPPLCQSQSQSQTLFQESNEPAPQEKNKHMMDEVQENRNENENHENSPKRIKQKESEENEIKKEEIQKENELGKSQSNQSLQEEPIQKDDVDVRINEQAQNSESLKDDIQVQEIQDSPQIIFDTFEFQFVEILPTLNYVPKSCFLGSYTGGEMGTSRSLAILKTSQNSKKYLPFNTQTLNQILENSVKNLHSGTHPEILDAYKKVEKWDYDEFQTSFAIHFSSHVYGEEKVNLMYQGWLFEEEVQNLGSLYEGNDKDILVSVFLPEGQSLKFYESSLASRSNQKNEHASKVEIDYFKLANCHVHPTDMDNYWRFGSDMSQFEVFTSYEAAKKDYFDKGIDTFFSIAVDLLSRKSEITFFVLVSPFLEEHLTDDVVLKIISNSIRDLHSSDGQLGINTFINHYLQEFLNSL